MRDPRPVLLVALLGAACAHGPGPSTPELPSPVASVAPRTGPALVAETLDGAPVDLGGPGPVRLVELWATWCGPCGPAAERARPILERHPRVVAYAVALDSDRAAVARHAASTPLVGTPLVYPGGVAAAARRGINQVPMFFAIDARGRVAGRVVGLTPGLGPALDRLLAVAEGRSGRAD